MTSAQTMQTQDTRAVSAWVALAIFGIVTLLAGCTNENLVQPMTHMSPYDNSRLWAIAPFANESGISSVDGITVADAFGEQAQQVQGLNVIPVNRVIRAMRQLEMSAVRSAPDAEQIMMLLGLDGLIVGTVTVWDPYRPPTLGIAIELYTNDPGWSVAAVDPQAISRQTSGEASLASMQGAFPTAQAAGIFDAANHATLTQLRNYALGRVEPESAFGEDIYLVSMDLYTKFVGHQLLGELLANEHARIQTVATAQNSR